jgi:hypothetical protein
MALQTGSRSRNSTVKNKSFPIIDLLRPCFKIGRAFSVPHYCRCSVVSFRGPIKDLMNFEMPKSEDSNEHQNPRLRQTLELVHFDLTFELYHLIFQI